MPLTTQDMFAVRREIGSLPDDTAVNVIYDRLLSVNGTIFEILETRLADFESSPASFSIFGEYSQSTDQNIIALREKLSRLRGELDDTTGLTDSGGFKVIPARVRTR